MIASRIQHIDVAKGIGMMLIIASHVWTTSSLSGSLGFKVWDEVLNSFYVPLFFLLSGVFESSSRDWHKYGSRLIKLAKYIAYFAVFGFITVGLLKGHWGMKSCLTGTVIWFLIVLSIMTAIFGIIKQAKHNLLITCAIGGVGYLLAINGHSYFYIGQALLCMPFYAVGYNFKDFFKKSTFDIKRFSISAALWIICLIFFYKAPQNIALNMVSQSFPTFYISAISGSIATIELSKLLNSRYLVWYGRNSIVPMMVQMLFIWIIARIVVADSMPIYYLLAMIACLASGACIPLFRNKYYDLFK